MAACAGAERRADDGGTGTQRRILVSSVRDDAGIGKALADQIQDDVRGAALVLPRSRYTVITDANIAVLLPPGQTFQDCVGQEGSDFACLLQFGRKVGADLVVDTKVRRVPGGLVGTVTVYDVRTGAMLAQRSREALDPGHLRRAMAALAAEVFGTLEPLSAPERTRAAATTGRAVPSVEPLEEVGELRPEEGILRIEGTPAGARVRVYGPRDFGDRGWLETTLPFGPRVVPAGEYRLDVSAVDHDSEERRVFVGADRTEVVRVELVPSYGVLVIDGRPEGARTEVRCERGYGKVFGLPGRITVPRGACEVTVERTGYQPAKQRIEVPGGKEARWSVLLEAIPSTGAAGAATSHPAREDEEERPTGGNWAWNPARPARFRAYLGVLGFKGLVSGPDHYMLTVFPLQVGMNLGGRWRLGALAEMGILFNGDAPKNLSSEDGGDARMVVDLGGYAGIQWWNSKSFFLSTDVTMAYQINGDRCEEWDMSVEKDRKCTGKASVPNGFVWGGRIGIGWPFFLVTIQVEHSLVNGVSIGGSFGITM